MDYVAGMRTTATRLLVVTAFAASALAVSSGASADKPSDATHADDVAAHWTPERVASAQPRDLVIDQRGLGYLKRTDGSLDPYGHSVRAQLTQVSSGARLPMGQPSASADGPTVFSNASPNGATVGGTVDFSATITDTSGIRSVSIVIIYPSGATQSFSAGSLGGDSYGTTLQGFSDGDWSWYILTKDGGKRGGNPATSPTWDFTVATGGTPPPPPPPTGGVVTNAAWSGGDVQLAAGRILFEMPTISRRRTTWNAYVCSGTVVTDTATNTSMVLTAAHCVYDDVAKMFARNVMFIPNQAGTTGTGTDWNCDNDPIGCWVPTTGVVDQNWTTRKFPNNVEWDYGYYLVGTGSHRGAEAQDLLEDAVSELTIGFDSGVVNTTTHALGYSYSEDPSFRYCAEPMSTASNVNWWLPNCGLSGGASGGPWLQPMDEAAGTGTIISVNSWGYTNQPGMAGPLLDASALCTYTAANNGTGSAVTGGRIASCP
jgi:hypothetical protein